MSIITNRSNFSAYKNDLIVEYVENDVPKTVTMCLHSVKYDKIMVPFGYGVSKKHKPTKHIQSLGGIEFMGTLLPTQVTLVNSTMHLLNSTNSSILSTPTGSGKTVMAVKTITEIKMRTLIIVNKLILVNQWIDSLIRFTNLTKDDILFVNPKSCSSKPKAKAKTELKDEIKTLNNDDRIENIPNHKVGIINLVNLTKFKHILSGYGYVIGDEIHNLMSPKLGKTILYLHPQYILGLSATPYRLDGLTQLIHLVFGNHVVKTELSKLHNVYKINTGIVFEERTNAQGKLDWTNIVYQQSIHRNRNDKIVELVNSIYTTTLNPDENSMLILCKRLDQVDFLYTKLVEMFPDKITKLIGGLKNTYDETKPVIIGTIQKGGVGFDNSRITVLVLASNVKHYFVQVLGRVFRNSKIPMIFDIVDENPILQNHWNIRKQIYNEIGGKMVSVANWNCDGKEPKSKQTPKHPDYHTSGFTSLLDFESNTKRKPKFKK